jgi:hypothetical protein
MGLAKRAWPEIVVHIPRIWEVERLNRIVVGSFGIQAESYSV